MTRPLAERQRMAARIDALRLTMPPEEFCAMPAEELLKIIDAAPKPQNVVYQSHSYGWPPKSEE